MSFHSVGSQCPALMHPERHARNGQLPIASGYHRLAEMINYLACRQRKTVIARARNLEITGGAVGADEFWSYFFRTGENVVSLQVAIGLTRTDYAFSSPPSVGLKIVNFATGVIADVIDVSFAGGGGAGTDIAAGEIIHGAFHLDNLLPNTEYWVLNTTQGGALPVYLTVHESQYALANDSQPVVADPSEMIADGPIDAATLEKMASSLDTLWRHNTAQLLTWTEHFGTASCPVISATSYADVLVSNVGHYLPLANRGRLTSSTVPVKMAVQALRLTGTGSLDVRLFDGTNQIAVTGITSGGGGSFYTAAGTLPAADATYEIQAMVTSGTFRLSSVCLFQYET